MAQIRTGQFTFDAARYVSAPLRYDRVLARAREAGESVECLCGGTPRPLVVRQVRGRHFLAVWPLDGGKHEPQCLFFRDEDAAADRRARLARVGVADEAEDLPGLDAAAEAIGKAVTAASATMAPAGPLDESGPDVAASPSAAPAAVLESLGAGSPAPGAVFTKDEALHPVLLPMLLGELWTIAGLQRWAPGWSRDWGRVRRSLRSAARRLSVHGMPLEEALYVAPERAERSGPKAEWELVSNEMRQSRRRHLVLGKVSAVSTTPYGWRLTLAGMAQPIFVPSRARTVLREACASAASAGGPGALWRVALVDVRLSSSGNVTAVDGHLQLVSQSWFLTEGLGDALVADTLAAKGRSFDKRLPAAVSGGAHPHPADVQLHDVGSDGGLAMLLLRPGSAVGRATQAEYALQRLASGHRVWVWDLAADALAQRMPIVPEAA